MQKLENGSIDLDDFILNLSLLQGGLAKKKILKAHRNSRKTWKIKKMNGSTEKARKLRK